MPPFDLGQFQSSSKGPILRTDKAKTYGPRLSHGTRTPMTTSASSGSPPGSSRRAETLMFLALSVLVWPVIAVGSVGAYGFAIWFYQILTH